jgi:hypothetical protein
MSGRRPVMGIDRRILAVAVFAQKDPPKITEEALARAIADLSEREKFVLTHRFTRPFKTLRAIGVITPGPMAGSA